MMPTAGAFVPLLAPQVREKDGLAPVGVRTVWVSLTPIHVDSSKVVNKDLGNCVECAINTSGLLRRIWRKLRPQECPPLLWGT